MSRASPQSQPASPEDPFHVPRWLDTFGGIVSKHPNWWVRLGNVETRVLADEVGQWEIERPIYISGLARSGSTILLELLAAHPDAVTHRYGDFPAVFTPVFWNWFRQRARRGGDEVAVERAHGDGIRVTPESPEAVEEMLWMAFFPQLHDPGVSQVLDAASENPDFEAFYRDHLRKLLWLRNGSRYLAKANYNVTRLEYLLRLFPDACFVLPVRSPELHVASLMRQHRRFCARHGRDPRALRYMRRLGHFEFGLQRLPINAGDRRASRRIENAWEEGREVEGWALLWNTVYGHVADALEASSALRRATLVLRHEDLCGDPVPMLTAVYAHCGLEVDEVLLRRIARRLRHGSRHTSMSERDRETIHRCTGVTAKRFGYHYHGNGGVGVLRSPVLD